MKLFFLDEDGSNLFQKWVPRGDFMLPAPSEADASQGWRPISWRICLGSEPGVNVRGFTPGGSSPPIRLTRCYVDGYLGLIHSILGTIEMPSVLTRLTRN